MANWGEILGGTFEDMARIWEAKKGAREQKKREDMAMKREEDLRQAQLFGYYEGKPTVAMQEFQAESERKKLADVAAEAKAAEEKALVPNPNWIGTPEEGQAWMKTLAGLATNAGPEQGFTFESPAIPRFLLPTATTLATRESSQERKEREAANIAARIVGQIKVKETPRPGGGGGEGFKTKLLDAASADYNRVMSENPNATPQEKEALNEKFKADWGITKERDFRAVIGKGWEKKGGELATETAEEARRKKAELADSAVAADVAMGIDPQVALRSAIGKYGVPEEEIKTAGKRRRAKAGGTAP